MKISFHGAARTVTGSQHLIEVNGHTLLLDCGLYQGKRKEAFTRNRTFPFDPQDIDAVILSHAHIDHSGNLPHLVKTGFKGKIYATVATTRLADVMLQDSGHIQEKDVMYVNYRRERRGQALFEPLYTQEDAANVHPQFTPVNYGEMFNPVNGVSVRLVEAGHILGSAAIELEIKEGSKKTRLWFSGDIGRRNLPLLRDPVLPGNVDVLIMECTYGDKPHADPEEAYKELQETVSKTIRRGGKVIIPAFSVGRTQELVYTLHKMILSGAIPRVPVFVDSPLAVNASDIFREFPEYFDEETQKFIKADRHHSALGFDLLTYTRSVEESKALNERKDPMVIISASGMAEAGRILHHLRYNIEDPKNTILIVSWQAPYTLGRRLADRETEVKIFGDWYTRRAEVATIGGYSAHAGQTFLVEYAMAAHGKVKKTFLVHGEPRGADALTEILREKGMERLYYPELNSSVEI